MGGSRKISNVHDAALLLGLTRVKAVSLGIAAMSNFAKMPSSLHFTPQDLWLHSLSIGLAMNALALAMPRAIRPQQDSLYLAGLLHDRGYMAIHHIDSAASNELHQQLRMQPPRPVLEVEQQILGVSHCHIGAQLASQWNLPEEIVAVLRGHHAPCEGEASPANSLIRLVNLAEKLLPDFGISEYCPPEISEQEWQALGIDPEKSDELRETVNELAVQAAQIADIF